MDQLYSRSLEYHNNHHSFRATGAFDYTKEDEELGSGDIAADVHIFTAENSNLTSITLTLEKLIEFLLGPSKSLSEKVK